MKMIGKQAGMPCATSSIKSMKQACISTQTQLQMKSITFKSAFTTACVGGPGRKWLTMKPSMVSIHLHLCMLLNQFAAKGLMVNSDSSDVMAPPSIVFAMVRHMYN